MALGVVGPLLLAAGRNGPPPRFEMQFKDLPMNEIIHRLGQENAIAISFEELPVTMEKDGVKLGEEIDRLEALANTGPLSERDAGLLKTFRRLLAEGHGRDTLADIRLPLLRCEIKARDEVELLAQLTAGSPYRGQRIGKTLVIRPREKSILDYPVKVHVKDQPLVQVVTDIFAQSRDEKIGFGMSVTIPVKPGVDSMPWLSRKITLDFEGSAVNALSAAIERGDPGVAWDLRGYKGSRGGSLTQHRHEPRR